VERLAVLQLPFRLKRALLLLLLSTMLSLLFLPLLLSSSRLVNAGWFPTTKQRFVEEHLIDAGNLGLPKQAGLVAAFGDFNADQLLDLVLLSSDQRSLAVWEWDRKAYEFKEKTETRIRTKSDFVVTNVVPGDFDYDGKLDLLVMGGKNPGGWWGNDETTEMQVYLQQPDGSFCASCFPFSFLEVGPLTRLPFPLSTAEPYPVDASTLPQVMPLDATGDMRTDLLGFAADSKTVPRLWTNSWESSNKTSLFSLCASPSPASLLLL
jgi:integrin alpha FG-GAP repeat containing protein 1